jgi:predicted GNAT family acetyltransferase
MSKQSALFKQQPERIGTPPEIWLENELFEQTKNYLMCGRRYQSLAIDQLNEEWAKAFRQFVKSQAGRHTRDMDDVGAELRLRGKGFPTHLVRAEVEQLRAFVKQIGRLPLCN